MVQLLAPHRMRVGGQTIDYLLDPLSVLLANPIKFLCPRWTLGKRK
jgi:hypothetical protein